MKTKPDKVYLIRGSTLARLEEEIRRRTPLPSNADGTSYRGPAGFTLPRGAAGLQAPFQISSNGSEIFVTPGLISVSHYNGATLIPRASQGANRLDEFPAPSCGTVGANEMRVHLTFDCLMEVDTQEGNYVYVNVLDSWVELATAPLPYREGANLAWRFHIPIGRVGPRGQYVQSLLNTNLQLSVVGPYLFYPPGVENPALHAVPTLTLFSPINTQE
jgi:hypothetical protein